MSSSYLLTFHFPLVLPRVLFSHFCLCSPYDQFVLDIYAFLPCRILVYHYIYALAQSPRAHSLPPYWQKQATCVILICSALRYGKLKFRKSISGLLKEDLKLIVEWQRTSFGQQWILQQDFAVSCKSNISQDLLSTNLPYFIMDTSIRSIIYCGENWSN